MKTTKRSSSMVASSIQDRSDGPYLATALAIADQLIQTAVPTASGVTWEGDDLLGEDEANLTVVRGPVGPYLYGGSAGIGWFLGHLAACARVASMREVAVEALRSALSATAETSAQQSLSLCSGAVGVALAAVDVGIRLRRPNLRRSGLDLAIRIAGTLRQGVEQISEMDLIGGVAGIVIGLLAIHRRAPDPVFLEACSLAAERLLQRRREDAWGTSWPEPAADTAAPALCGLGHGASGPAWALSELDWTTGNQRFERIVREALRYERGWCSLERCAWADLRQSRAASVADGSWPAWTTAWCHGALGIGALRWRIYEVTRDLSALVEASAAIQAARELVAGAGSALQQPQLSDVTLCHGLGGAIELMLLAYEITGLREHQQAARRAGDLCLSIYRANQNRWTVGVRGGEHVPGIFLGLAGVGVTMLRLHDPTLIGSPMLPGRAPVSQKSDLIASRSA
jgi:lantibiotic modifying enzyme